MSDTIGPVHIKDRPSSEMQSRVDAEVRFLEWGSCDLTMMFVYS